MMTDNNKKDKRFSKLLSTIEKGKVLPDKQLLDQLRDKSVKEFETFSGKNKEHLKAETIPIWRIIMKSRITKIAAAVLIIAILIGINQFGGSVDGSSVAFGQVLEYFQTFSYTFDLTVDTVAEKQGSVAFTMQAMVWELGRMRVDCPLGIGTGVGNISSITDFNAGRTLLLFHQNKTGVIKKESVLNKNTGAGGIISFCTKPIENLWNVRDSTEEQLGEKEIHGQKATGFRIFQEDQYFEYDITIWADSESSVPSLVEAIARPLDESYPSIKWTMENFDLDVELGEGLFSLDLPTGYTLAYHEDLEKLEVETEASDESEKIVQMLELWSEGRKDEAIELLLGIDWTEQIEFGKEPYIFSMTERGYISLKADDQKRAMEEIMAAAVNVRKIVYGVLDLAKAAIASNEYEQAERHFGAALQLGKLLERDPDRMIMIRLVGIAIEKKTLNEMIDLYTTMNDREKLRAAKSNLEAAKSEGDRIKKEAMGR
jgi:hypothetical protein